METNRTTKHHRPAPRRTTHEGGRAVALRPEQQLLKLVGNCLLFENNFYSSGLSIATEIAQTAKKCDPRFVANLAVFARQELGLRHVSLWLTLQQFFLFPPEARHHPRRLVFSVIQRADELAEILSLYWRYAPGRSGEGQNRRAPIPPSLKRGIADAFRKFSQHDLAKYNRDKEISLRDVMFLTHPKPRRGMTKAFRDLASGTLAPPQTWEVLVSREGNKKEIWEGLIKSNQIGYLALLRNLRNMEQAGVDRELIEKHLLSLRAPRIFPYQFVAAWRAAPSFEKVLSKVMLRTIRQYESFFATTAVLVDVSGSMEAPMSFRGNLTRMDAAASIALLVSATIGQNSHIYSVSDRAVKINDKTPNLGLIDRIKNSQPNFSTLLGAAVRHVLREHPSARIILITDEQSHDNLPRVDRGYIINVASEIPGIANESNGWIRIDSFSDRVLDWIAEHEMEEGSQEERVWHYDVWSQ